MSIRRYSGELAALVILVMPLSPALAQRAEKNGGGPEPDAGFAQFQWYREVDLPANDPKRHAAFFVPPPVFGKARADLGDLRLGDANGKRVPYALRVLRTGTQQKAVPIVRRFNEGAGPSGSYQVCLELRDIAPPGYNEIQIDTTGTEFRRRVEVFGSDTDDFQKAQRLLPGKDAHVLHLRIDAEPHEVERRRFQFSPMQYRFVRVMVYPDADSKADEPRIESVTVRQAVPMKGTYLTYGATLEPRQYVRGEGGAAATAWFIDLGAPVPCEALSFVAAEQAQRPFRLEIADTDRRGDIGATWKWRSDPTGNYLEATFPEVQATRFRLVVTDYENPPLELTGAWFTTCARQVVFASPPEKGFATPLRLYYGNPAANPPHYDLEQKLPIVLTPAPLEATLGKQQENPDYIPPPKTLAERMPWLVYVVLGIACAVLLGVLGLLARQAIARADTVRPAEPASPH
jgi:hypothetical protein